MSSSSPTRKQRNHIRRACEMSKIQISVCYKWKYQIIISITLLITFCCNIHNRYSGLHCSCGSYWIEMLKIKTWYFSDRASWIDYILITNLMRWLLFIRKILFSSTCFEHQVLVFRRIQLYTCSLWYCHSLWEFLVACRYTAVYRQATRNSHREWQYYGLHVYNCILLKMSTWGSKHVEENNISRINNNQRIKLVINI